MEDPQKWDLESVYDNEISPLIRQITLICLRNKIPMLACFAYSTDGLSMTSLPIRSGASRTANSLIEAAVQIQQGREEPHSGIVIYPQEDA